MEDCQPNERLSQKTHIVPSIRTTNSFRGKSRSSSKPQSTRTSWNRQPPNPDYPTTPSSASSSNSLPLKRSRPGNFALHGTASPPKKPRLDGPSSSSSNTQGSRRKRKPPKKASRVDVVSDFPRECSHGMPSCHSKRRDWVAQEKQRLLQRGLVCRSYEIQNNSIRFFCFPEGALVDHDVKENHDSTPSSTAHAAAPEQSMSSLSLAAKPDPQSNNPQSSHIYEATPAIHSSLCSPPRIPTSPPSSRLSVNFITSTSSDFVYDPSPCFLSGNILLSRENISPGGYISNSSSPYDSTSSPVPSLPDEPSLHESLRQTTQSPPPDSLPDLANATYPEEYPQSPEIQSIQVVHPIDELSRSIRPMPEKASNFHGFVLTTEEQSRHQISHNDASNVVVAPLTRPLEDPTKPRKRGASAVVALPSSVGLGSTAFVSGGYDHAVHLWTLPSSSSTTTQPLSPTLLKIPHRSEIRTLLPFRDRTSHKLLTSGADCIVNVWDFGAQKVVWTGKTSSPVYHAHDLGGEDGEFEGCTLFQVAHRELPFEIRDHRVGGVGTNAGSDAVATAAATVRRFGRATSVVNGRYIKGSMKASLFACGTRSGTVAIWDIRKTDDPVVEFECALGRSVLQVIWKGNDIVAVDQDHYVWRQPVEGTDS
ncbi:hypothetical protein DL96DRAFT_1703736 [Flagelloscypha sp. PMI_526]|nr:hypothetical protein DL96DRAFT_1703736 [Flagelloscypha sp. PMI_526]